MIDAGRQRLLRRLPAVTAPVALVATAVVDPRLVAAVLVIAAMLIITFLFQTDYGLGSISYLMW